jgi:hypothetical protein
MTEREPAKTAIRARTAVVLYAVLIVIALATLRGKPLALALIIVLGLAVKSYLDSVRRKLE